MRSQPILVFRSMYLSNLSTCDGDPYRFSYSLTTSSTDSTLLHIAVMDWSAMHFCSFRTVPLDVFNSTATATGDFQ